MKFPIRFNLFLVLLFALVGCGGDMLESETVDTGSIDQVTEFIEEEPAVYREFSEEADDSAESLAFEPVPTQAQAEPIVPESNTDPAGMNFEEVAENPFTLTIDDNLSTFAIDVDTGSYTVMRSYLSDYGSMPPAESVRVEEYINYFDQQYDPPVDGAFAIHLEGAPAPYGENENYHLVRVGIQGYDVPAEERPNALLIFVIDTSGSMDQQNRLGLVKASLELLVGELQPGDRVGIVEYGSSGNVLLEPTSIRDRFDIMQVIDGLRTGGSTNIDNGIQLAYQMANRYRLDGEITRLIVLSDGVANVGDTTVDGILENARRGVSLSTFGFGMGNYNDALMEQLSNDGDGSYAYVDTLREAQRVFVKDLSGTLLTIAKDAKIQVEFNPETVLQYRLIGYENRAIADEDFRNDTVDAGEIGAGHSVTALYEIRLNGDVDPNAEALAVHVRYNDPETGANREIARAMSPGELANSFAETSPTFQLTAVVAEYAEILRNGYWTGDNSLENVWQEMERVATMFPRSNDVGELVDLIETAVAYSR